MQDALHQHVYIANHSEQLDLAVKGIYFCGMDHSWADLTVLYQSIYNVVVTVFLWLIMSHLGHSHNWHPKEGHKYFP